MLNKLMEKLGKLFMVEGLPGLQHRVDAGDTNAMVDLAVALSLLETKEEAKKRSGLYGGKTFGLLEQAANKGNERGVSLLFAHFMGCFRCNLNQYQLKQLRKYGCILVRKRHRGAKKFLASKFPNRPCE